MWAKLSPNSLVILEKEEKSVLRGHLEEEMFPKEVMAVQHGKQKKKMLMMSSLGLEHLLYGDILQSDFIGKWFNAWPAN